MTRLILTALCITFLAFPALGEVRWDITDRQATPYLVDKKPDGHNMVINLDNGEVGINRPGFGTIQTGKRPDPTMEILLNEPYGDSDSEDN
jgi:hypothetical protein